VCWLLREHGGGARVAYFVGIGEGTEDGCRGGMSVGVCGPIVTARASAACSAQASVTGDGRGLFSRDESAWAPVTARDTSSAARSSAASHAKGASSTRASGSASLRLAAQACSRSASGEWRSNATTARAQSRDARAVAVAAARAPPAPPPGPSSSLVSASPPGEPPTAAPARLADRGLTSASGLLAWQKVSSSALRNFSGSRSSNPGSPKKSATSTPPHTRRELEAPP
jgi:hypothetical protein